jgi:sialic acid synthase SpsE
MQTKQAAYQARNTGSENSQYEMLKKLELSKEQHYELINYCKHTVNAYTLMSKYLKCVVLSNENTVLLTSNSHEQSF